MVKRLKLKEKFNDFREMPIIQKCNFLAFLFLWLFVIDVSFFGGGKYVTVFSITPRMFFAVLALFLSIPKLIKNLKTLIKNPIVIFFLIFLLWIIICAIRGYVAGNRIDVLLSDVKGYMWLFLLAVFFANVDSLEKLGIIFNCVLIGATGLSIFVLLINLLCVLAPSTIGFLYNLLLDSAIGHLGVVSPEIIRIFVSSSPFVFLAISVAVFRQLKNKKISAWYTTVAVLGVYTIFVTFTRSLYGGLALALMSTAALAVLVYFDRIKVIIKVCIVTVLIFCVSIFVLQFTLSGNYLPFAISRTFGVQVSNSLAVELRESVDEIFDKETTGGGSGSSSDQGSSSSNIAINNYLGRTEVSDDVRRQTVYELKELIKQNPIFGNGLGASAASRETGLDEYFYLNTIARIGFVGLTMYMLPLGYVVILTIKKRKTLIFNPETCAAYSGFAGLLLSTYFNPWLNAVLGITIYLLVCVSFNIVKDKEKEGQSSKEISQQVKEEKE